MVIVPSQTKLVSYSQCHLKKKNRIECQIGDRRADNTIINFYVLYNSQHSQLGLASLCHQSFPCPHSRYLVAIILKKSFLKLLFFFCTDGIDGKQARRTQSSTPLGELFDHGLVRSKQIVKLMKIYNCISFLRIPGLLSLFLQFCIPCLEDWNIQFPLFVYIFAWSMCCSPSCLPIGRSTTLASYGFLGVMMFPSW